MAAPITPAPTTTSSAVGGGESRSATGRIGPVAWRLVPDDRADLDRILLARDLARRRDRRPRDAVVSVWDHGFLYGDGVFEGIRVRAGRLYRPQQHLARLRGSARAIALEMPYDEDELLAAIAATVRANALDEAHVRVLVARGVGLPGVDPGRCPRATTLVLAYPFPPLLGSAPITLITSSVSASRRARCRPA